MLIRWVTLVAAALCGLCGCSPALDWREVRAEGSGIVALFPCKPDRHVRTVSLAVQSVRMEMLVCSAGGVNYALAFFDVSEPARVTAALHELQSLAASNLASIRQESRALSVSGMTPNPRAARLVLEGRQPDGAGLEEQAAFFVKGLRIYQATVLGRKVPAESADNFFGGLRLPA